ncbi:mechanosensitive ion channel [Marinobacter salinisoli]|uniref:Small-conductance mechanosensitive channel n=1 Tax=Marinobacter salinisoli TaxID=2769486 RepID=A0ABX7MMM5_9GAMM|nr:mechanosensitive ion channel family protein [Marinobacter salinisoli]QSP93289.1 mechanosensitive ion channel [Marinobacter salinisoli]
MDINVAPLDIIESRIEGISQQFVQALPNLVAALFFLALVWVVNRLVIMLYRRVLAKTRLRPSLQSALLTLTKVGIWISGILIAATIAMPNLTPTKLLAGLGLGSLAIGLAFKDIFENFMAGVMVLLREPMRIGDFIEVEGIEGEVTQITLRDTYIRQVNGDLVLLPNSTLYKNAVFIHTDRTKRRITVICGIAYGEDIAQGREIIRTALTGLESVDASKGVEVFAREFGSSSINFEITWWTGSRPIDIRTSKDEVIEAVKAALDKAGIEIPFPYRTLTFKEPLPVTQTKSAS